MTQICAVHIQNQKERTSAFTVEAKATLQENAPVDQTTTERNQGQHLGTSRIKEQGNTGSKNHVSNQNRYSHHQLRFNKRFNKQYSPNYNNSQTSPLGSIPGQDLSTTLIELANIQSRSLEMMVASQRSQQEAFYELTKASRDKANDAMFANIKNYDGKDRQIFKDWIDEINQACWVSNHDFRTEIIKKLSGAVQKVVMSCEHYTDNTLLAKLRSCFSDAPTMNEAREELRNMRQMENESIAVYMYRWE